MYKWERMTTRGRRGGFEREIPSFSSSLLNKIYHSIDEEVGADRTREWSLYACSVGGRKKSESCTKAGEVEKREPMQRRGHGFYRDAEFFSSTSSSSDSSSNRFSSSDTESCVVPPRPKPVRTRVSAVPDKTGAKTEFVQFREQRKRPGRLDGEEEMIVKTKSRVLSFYSNLMKSKHPISPGRKLASFINSIFATNVSVRKPKKLSASPVVKSGDSSASSFSRLCLSKYSPTTREKLRDGAKRSVRFNPVSVILDEDSRPCGHKMLYPKEDETRYNRPMERSSQVKEASIEFLRNYRRNQNRIEEKVNATAIRSSNSQSSADDDVDRDDDTASCTSSDLFELDHLDMLGNGMYCEELPVYETTDVGTIGAITSTLMM